VRLRRGAAAAAVFLIAGAGQAALEAARAAGSRPSVLAPLALVASAILAVVVLRDENRLPTPPRGIELPCFLASLYAWTAPGVFALVLALFFHLARPGDPRAAASWITGLVLILLPGAVDWWRRRHGVDARRLAAAVALFLVAFGVRVVGGIDRIPAFVDSDEAESAIAARAVAAQGPGALFGFWEMGNPNVTVIVSRVAAAPFGGDDFRALRLGSALLGSLTVVLVFDFGSRLIGMGPAFFAALLLAFNHAFLHWGRVGQIYVDTPFFASLVLALLLRAFTGGSFLTLTGATVALGIGAVTYVPTAILPFVVALTIVGWATSGRWPARRVAAVLAFAGGIVVLIVTPIIVTVLRTDPEIAYQRIPAISLLRPDGLRQLAGAYGISEGRAIAEHLVRTVGIFNFGWDSFKAYGAPRALCDPFTAALVPAAAAVLLARLRSPIGWMSILFAGSYLTGGVLLCATQPTYHRASVVLLFVCLGIAWTVTGLARALAAESPARRWLPAALAVVFVVASAASNLHFYFREYPRTAQERPSAAVLSEARELLAKATRNFAVARRPAHGDGLAVVRKVNEQQTLTPSSDALLFARSTQIVLPGVVAWRSAASVVRTTRTFARSIRRAFTVPATGSTDMTRASSGLFIPGIENATGVGTAVGVGAGVGRW
jgi:4-amino-4-deoxy-L-arabinose transferase-like glycosyltransferase